MQPDSTFFMPILQEKIISLLSVVNIPKNKWNVTKKEIISYELFFLL